MASIDIAETMLERALSEFLSEAMETMAFMFPAPLETLDIDGPQLLCRVQIDFTGDRNGTMELITQAAFASALAANLLGTDPTDPDAIAGAHDALKEMASVTCGLLLRSTGASGAMSLPRLEQFDAPLPALIPGKQPIALQADGHIVMASITFLKSAA